MAELIKLLFEALKDKGEMSTIDAGKKLANPKSNLNSGTKATNVHVTVLHEQHPQVARNLSTQPFIYLYPIIAPHLVQDFSLAIPIVPDLDGQVEQERAKRFPKNDED